MRSLLPMFSLFLAPFVAGQVLFDRLTTADGLPSNGVRALFEDRDGYIWAGTEDGLARLEGSRIRVFHHDHNDPASLAHDQVNGITQDAAGTLWFATMDGLSRFDATHASFSNLRIPATGNDVRRANRMLQVLALGDSLMWVVTEAGLHRFDIRSSSFSSVQGRPPGQGPAGLINAAGAVCWDPGRRTLWAGTQQGLASWDARTGRWTDHRTTSEEPWAGSMATDIPMVNGDSLWFLRNKPYLLCAFDLRRKELHVQPDIGSGPNRFTLRAQAIDHAGGHWLCTWTHQVFHRPKGAAWSEIVADQAHPGTIPSTRVSAMLLTRTREHWFATAEGIAALRPSSASVIPLFQVPDGRAITALGSLGQDTLLAGTAGGGVCTVDQRTGRGSVHVRPMPGQPNAIQEAANFIRAFGPVHNGRMLVCTSRGLSSLDVRSLSLSPVDALDEAFSPARRSAFTFAARAGDLIWAGTWVNGLWWFDEGSGDHGRVDTVEGPFGKLPSRLMLSWLTDRSGRSWVGMNDGGGLACLENGRFRTITDADGGNLGGVVRVMAQGPDGRIWLGTHEQGLVVYDPRDGGARYYTRRDGLPGTRIHALHFARDGTLWTATPQGFAYMSPGTMAFRSLYLPSDLRAEGANTLLELTDGRIVLAVDDRLLLHDPSIAPEPEPPLPVFTGHRVNDRSAWGAPTALELRPDRKALTLELGTVGHHFGPPPYFRYRPSLEDTTWKEIGTAARIDLFDLAPGAYDIQVQASADGVHWSISAASMRVHVLPPFHATWWFRTLMVLLLLLGLALGFRLYLLQRLREQRVTFEREQAVLAERMRIAGDMHDDLGAGLSALKLRSEMALRVEKDPVRRDQLGSLARTAGELIGSMRQIIWTMNADQSSVADLFVYTTNYARQYCDENRVALAVVVDKLLPASPLSSEQRRNIFLVVKEALHNVVKHAGAGRAELRMTCTNGMLDVRIMDDGAGLPTNVEASEGNGLRNMRRRIAALGGTLTLGRADGLSGAGVWFQVPVVTPPNLRSIGSEAPAEDLRSASPHP